MIRHLSMRFLHWKKQWISLLVWLILPFVITVCMIYILDKTSDEATIPVGIVLEKESPLAEELIEQLENESYYHVYKLNEDEALHQLEKHELDSLFIISDKYDDKIKQGNRNKLIKAYKSDMSFAYVSTNETIQSIVQQQASRYKTIEEVEKLYKHYEQVSDKTDEEIIQLSKEIEEEATLLTSSMRYNDGKVEENNELSISPRVIWSFISFLTTFFLFDWVMKEKQANAKIRFIFSIKSFRQYLLESFILYTVLLFIVDIMTFIAFQQLYGGIMTFSLFALLFLYRLFCNLCAFVFASISKNIYIFYLVGLSLFLICIVFYVVSISTSSFWLIILHPMMALENQTYINIWNIILMLLFITLFIRKERIHD